MESRLNPWRTTLLDAKPAAGLRASDALPPALPPPNEPGQPQ